MADRILTFNAGSSNLKLALFDVTAAGRLALVFRGKLDFGDAEASLVVTGPDGTTAGERRWPRTAGTGQHDFFVDLIGWAEKHGQGGAISAVGHRVVHGGKDFADPVAITGDVLERLDALTPLAPLHQPHNLAPIRALRGARPDLPQVACFDTAFHRGRAPVAKRFALPREYEDAGIERYGFHGISYEYIAGALPGVAPELGSARVIVAHLGNGASLCALRAGQSIDTTMSFTALDGLPMGTRCGAIDPGVLLYLMRERNMDADALEDLLYHCSGLLGVSDVSGDMRVLLASDRRRAADAVDLFVFRTAREIGSLAAALGGLDGLVFTAGIGEHAAPIREMVCKASGWLGVALDREANLAGGPLISSKTSRVAVWVMPTDEETMIARHALTVITARRAAADSGGP